MARSALPEFDLSEPGLRFVREYSVGALVECLHHESDRSEALDLCLRCKASGQATEGFALPVKMLGVAVAPSSLF